jgi:hypothetical protein
MISPTRTPVMRVYDGTVVVGEIEDHGNRCVIAYQITSAGRVAIGRFPDRRSAMRAIEVNSPTPRGAA